ncbi:hypothetical protein BC831DRAFT_461281 [Entophlyctis helioformis]|nr:hypothetical protein BC831DRAFT_461281 [Entophlyctis helioformis]
MLRRTASSASISSTATSTTTTSRSSSSTSSALAALTARLGLTNLAASIMPPSPPASLLGSSSMPSSSSSLTPPPLSKSSAQRKTQRSKKGRRKAAKGRGKKSTKPLAHAFAFRPSSHLASCTDHQDALRELDLDYFKVFIAPAAGPRAFVSAGFEKRLKSLLKNDQISSVKWLVGGSTGALRFMAFVNSLVSNRNLTWELKEHYVRMYYKTGDTPSVLKPMMEQVYSICAPEESVARALKHPTFKLAILVANISPWFRHLPDPILKLVLAGYFVGNMVNPNILSTLCTRICFYTGDEPPTFMDHGLGGGANIQYVPLTPANVNQVLHATTCVPFVQENCNYIDGVGHGRFVDSALTDYYLNFSVQDPTLPALLLADSEDCHIFPTAFDSYLPWKRVAPQSLFKHCSAVFPEASYLHALPDRSLPSMGDWFKEEYIANPAKRHRHWRAVFDLSERHWHAAMLRAKSISTQ